MIKLKHLKIVSVCCIALIALYACGDKFALRKHIIRNYYLFEEEDLSDFSIRFRLTSGDYIGRIPAPIAEYGWNDSILVAKVKRGSSMDVYIINMKNDFEFAEVTDYLIGTMNEQEFYRNWQKKLRIRFKKI